MSSELTKGKEEIGTLALGEFHPGAHFAFAYIRTLGEKLFLYRESFASCGLAGDRLSEICGETLRRVLNHEPVSDRYVMGLAWTLWNCEQNEMQS